jgi:hypothetical protein
MVTVLSMQVFPVEGFCYLLGLGNFQEQIDKDLFSNTDESDADDDPIKIKKQEYLSAFDAPELQFKLQVLNATKPSFKVVTSMGHQPELIIPPPNFL